MCVCLYMCNAFDEWNNSVMIVSTDVPALLVVGGLGT